VSSFSGDRGAELRQIFFESAQEILQSMNEQALRLEKRPDDIEALRSLRRAVHTLKGDAAACGFRELSHLAHEFEDVLVGENLAQSAATVETALAAADVFSEMLEAYSTGKRVASAESLRKLIQKLASPEGESPSKNQHPAAASRKSVAKSSPHVKAQRIKPKKAKTQAIAAKAKVSAKSGHRAKKNKVTTKSAIQNRNPSAKQTSVANATKKRAVPQADSGAISTKKALPSAPQPVWTEYERLAVESARHKSVPVYHLTLQIDKLCGMPEAALQIVRNILAKTGEILAFSPTEARGLNAARTIDAVCVTQETPENLTRKCRVPGIVSAANLLIMPALGAQPPAATEPTVPAQESAAAAPASAIDETSRPGNASAENLLRVDAERIDNVLNLVGELIIGRSMFHQTLLEFAKRYPKDPLRTRFADAFAFQARVLNDLQRSVMKIRMVPVEQLFRRFPRLVRDTARACSKTVELTLSGQETDLDKGILDALAEPVAHLIRNAISHGIENVEDRKRANKPEHGTLRLSAYHQGNQMVIEVADDGRGLDADRIRNKAIARGLVNGEDAQRLTESDLFKFIFAPGFSTAEQITEISGRGVGLDVVQNVLQRLKGSVSVESIPGQSTVFRLRLPLTLAIIKAILFRVEHRLYAVPLNSVAEMTRVHQSEIHLVDGHEVMQLRKQVLTLVRLGRPAETTDSRLFVLVVSHAGQKLGLVVDELAGQEELVIKALDTSILSSDLISGVSILGDGRVVLILNLAAVAERRNRTRNELGAAPWGMLLPQSEMRQFETAAAAAIAGGGA
jgi:two-component system, chemotaxis family, sensor kinase CheA